MGGFLAIMNLKDLDPLMIFKSPRHLDFIRIPRFLMSFNEEVSYMFSNFILLGMNMNPIANVFSSSSNNLL